VVAVIRVEEPPAAAIVIDPVPAPATVPAEAARMGDIACLAFIPLSIWIASRPELESKYPDLSRFWLTVTGLTTELTGPPSNVDRVETAMSRFFPTLKPADPDG
jgi:hypothetical protein